MESGRGSTEGVDGLCRETFKKNWNSGTLVCDASGSGGARVGVRCVSGCEFVSGCKFGSSLESGTKIFTVEKYGEAVKAAVSFPVNCYFESIKATLQQID